MKDKEWDGIIHPVDFTTLTSYSRTGSWFPSVSCAVKITHVPTGEFAEVSISRSVNTNKSLAWIELHERLISIASSLKAHCPPQGTIEMTTTYNVLNHTVALAGSLEELIKVIDALGITDSPTVIKAKKTLHLFKQDIPTTSQEDCKALFGTVVLIEPGDTLSGLAAKHCYTEASKYQMWYAIWAANPQVFRHGSINTIWSGEFMRIPSLHQVLCISSFDAENAIKRMN